jgi:AsmA-like C-terminal region
VGAASAKYQIEVSGLSAAELLDSAKGTLQFEMRDGALPHILLSSTPLRVRRFSGILSAKDGDFELREATLDSPTTSYTVTGKASLARKLDFKLVAEGSPGLNVTGTLAEPRVVPAQRPETQAALKP